MALAYFPARSGLSLRRRLPRPTDPAARHFFFNVTVCVCIFTGARVDWLVSYWTGLFLGAGGCRLEANVAGALQALST